MNTSFQFSKANKFKDISSGLKTARFLLIDHVIETKQAIPFEQAIEIVGEEVLKQLLEKNIVNLNQDNEVFYLYPVSAAPTGHSVKLEDGRQFNTMCAFDSLGCANTFHMGCEIFSACRDTSEKVYIKLSEQGIETALPETLVVSYLDVVGKGSCDCCGIMNFFQYEENAREALKQYENDENMYLWPLNDAFTAAKMVFDN